MISKALILQDSSGKKKEVNLTSHCQVCGDAARNHVHYGATSCYSCRAFFRRNTSSENYKKYNCQRRNSCVISPATRTLCSYCRYQKCLQVGMQPEYVMNDNEKRELKIKRENKSTKQTSYDDRMR